MKPKDIIKQAKATNDELQREQLIRKAFSVNYRAAKLSVKAAFPELLVKLNTDEALFNFIFPEKSKIRTCKCGAKLKFRGVQRGYGTYCSHKCYSVAKDPKEKRAKTNLEKYGAIAPLGSKAILLKAQATNLEKYGSICSAQGKDQQAIILPKLRLKAHQTVKKASRTLFERTGYTYAWQLPITKQRTIEKLNSRWQQRVPEIAKELLKDGITLLQAPNRGEVGWQLKHSCGTKFEVQSLNLAYKCPKCFDNSRSYPEAKVLQLVRNIEQFVISGDRKIITPYELDIVVPHKKIAIEVNGTYWHRADSGTCPILKKTVLAEHQGFKLLHFWDHEVLRKTSIVGSIISNALGTSIKLNARDFDVDLAVSAKESAEFLSLNHLQGPAPASIRLGLRSKSGELCCLLTLAKARFDKKATYEIVRFCSKLGITVRGALSKLFKHAPSGSYVTYADRRFYSGAGYKAIGFEFSHNSIPNYSWVRGTEIISRYDAQKHKLQNLLQVFDSNKSERDNMLSNGFHKVEDCGSAVFRFEKV